MASGLAPIYEATKSIILDEAPSAQYHRRMNECITTKRTASVRCLHPEQQIQSEILSTTPTTKTSEGLCHVARDRHVIAAGLCKALGVAWEKKASVAGIFLFKWATQAC